LKLYCVKWLIILLTISYIAIPIHALEIRGSVAGTVNGVNNLVDSSFTWDTQNFAGFYYDLDNDIGADILKGVVTGEWVNTGGKLSGESPYGITYITTDQMKYFNNARIDKTYGKMRVASINNTTGEIVMDNKDNLIRLSKNEIFELMPGTFIRIADNDTLRYYIYKNITNPGTYEIRGAVAGSVDGVNNLVDNSFTWDTQNFAGFFYDVKKEIGTETLVTQLSGDDGRKLSGISPYGITYTTTVQSKAYQRALWGAYSVIGFMGDQFFAGYLQGTDEATGSNIFYAESTGKNSLSSEQLEKILIDEKTKILIKKGESIKLKEGYELVLKGANNEGKIYVELLKDGKTVDESFLAPSKDMATELDKTYFYRKNVGEQNNLVIIGMHFRSSYKDEEQSMAIVDGLWQISDTPVDVMADIQYDKMTITSIDATTGVITMNNKDQEIDLTRKSDIYLMPGISIRTADNETFRYYIYKTEIVGKNPA
jgi:S-layer protein (TIGR01567 family)